MGKSTLPGLPALHTGTIFCIGRNYVEHARELQNEVPGEPVVFLKPVSSIIYDGDSIQLPSQSKNVQHEIELVVAIGKTGKNIPEHIAYDYIAGYTVGIDVTARDIQQRAKEKALPWSVAKGFDTFAPLGHFVGKDRINDPKNLHLELKVNGETRQSDSTGLMIFPVSRLISYLSDIFTLQPGDLIFTGTPKGVSPLQKGDQIQASLSLNNDSTPLVTISVDAA